MEELPFLKKSGEAIFQDRFVKKAAELLIPWNSSPAKSRFGLIGAPLSKPSISHSGAAFAPTTIRKMLSAYTTYSVEMDKNLNEGVIDFGDIMMHPTDIVESQARIQATIIDIIRKKTSENLLILGGDHSISFSSIQAFATFHKHIGVIQFDAHHDFRNLEDGGPTNGTPFRRLLDQGVISGDQLVQIGIRDFCNSKEYREYGEKHKVSIFTMKEIRHLSAMQIVQKAIDRLGQKVDAIYLSVDIDVLDQAFAPGCPAIGPGGMDSQTLLEAVELLAQYKHVKAIDIVEVDPTIDFRDMTSRVAAWVILSFLKGKLERHEK